jgi:hypothetical protein
LPVSRRKLSRREMFPHNLHINFHDLGIKLNIYRRSGGLFHNLRKRGKPKACRMQVNEIF